MQYLDGQAIRQAVADVTLQMKLDVVSHFATYRTVKKRATFLAGAVAKDTGQFLNVLRLISVEHYFSRYQIQDLLKLVPFDGPGSSLIRCVPYCKT